MRTHSKLFPLLLILPFFLGCESDPADPSDPDPDPTQVDRHEAIPSDVAKVTPEEDPTPPILHSDEFQEPIPLPGISTAGAEDAPFIPASGEELYFYFAADVREPAETQIQDPVNGIWVSKRSGDAWEEPTLVWLQQPGTLSLNGCPFVDGDEMYFCSAREGYSGLNWFRAERVDGEWTNWQIRVFDPALRVGELHIQGNQLFFDSDREGGQGLTDIWMATSEDGGAFADPVNIEVVNSPEYDSRPYVSPDGNELWVTRWVDGSPSLFRSMKVEGEWQEAELMVSRFAGEATLDADGNLYFVHHFFINGTMREADIYVAYRK